MDAEGRFAPTEDHIKAAHAMFASLLKWTPALATMRRQQGPS
jgi:hypothetical protein